MEGTPTRIALKLTQSIVPKIQTLITDPLACVTNMMSPGYALPPSA